MNNFSIQIITLLCFFVFCVIINSIFFGVLCYSHKKYLTHNANTIKSWLDNQTKYYNNILKKTEQQKHIQEKYGVVASFYFDNKEEYYRELCKKDSLIYSGATVYIDNEKQTYIVQKDMSLTNKFETKFKDLNIGDKFYIKDSLIPDGLYMKIRYPHDSMSNDLVCVCLQPDNLSEICCAGMIYHHTDLNSKVYLKL